MAIYISSYHDPYLNLAIEELLLRHTDEELFMLWQSTSAFVFGRNQNPFLEIAPEFFQKEIPMIRRISGGGTIYQDMGTINFSFITSKYTSKINNYEYFLSPIINALNKLGIAVTFEPKSSLYIGDKKISGNAQSFTNNRLVHHGTLLYNTDIKMIQAALVDCGLSGKGNSIASNRQKVANIKDYTNKELVEIEECIMNEVIHNNGIYPKEYILSSEQLKMANDLVETKYKSETWTFAKTLNFEIEIRIKEQVVTLNIRDGIIIDVSDSIYNLLIGIRYASMLYVNLLKQFN